MAFTRHSLGAALRRGLSIATMAAVLAACSPGSPSVDCGGDGDHSSAAGSSEPSPSSSSMSGGISKVLTIVLENHGVAAVTAGMPDLMTLAGTYGQTSDYRAATHPSLPNYLLLAGGSMFGVKDDKPPAAHHVAGPSVFDLAVASGQTAKTYTEAMPTNCAMDDQGRYAVRHNPWTYFSDDASRRACAVGDVPLGDATSGALHDDIAQGTLPAIGLVVPDVCNDAHSCPLATADAWVSGWITQVLAGPDWLAGRLAVVITFDESERSSDNTVLTVVAAPGLHGAVSDEPLTHSSWTRWMSDLIGVVATGDARDAPSLGAAFGL